MWVGTVSAVGNSGIEIDTVSRRSALPGYRNTNITPTSCFVSFLRASEVAVSVTSRPLYPAGTEPEASGAGLAAGRRGISKHAANRTPILGRSAHCLVTTCKRGNARSGRTRRVSSSISLTISISALSTPLRASAIQ